MRISKKEKQWKKMSADIGKLPQRLINYFISGNNIIM
jgi:hypothetical protein